MISELFTNPLSFLIWVIALLVAITIHEFSHAKSADYFGDPTAKIAGRITLNPFAHLDIYGTIFLLFFRFGWGKPVPVDPYNLKNPRRDSAIISLSGPASNIILAFILSILVRFMTNLTLLNPNIFFTLFLSILQPIIILNVALGIFNLIPIHPLDGGKILVGLLPEESARDVDAFLERYGIFLLIFAIFPIFNGGSIITQIIAPIINFILTFLIPTPPLI